MKRTAFMELERAIYAFAVGFDLMKRYLLFEVALVLMRFDGVVGIS